MNLTIAGYRSVSLMDVHGHPSFALWVCGCNLRCPYCHNWKIASNDTSICKQVPIDSVLDPLKRSSKLVDYLHVTGGEPLLHVKALKELFEAARSLGLRVSVNTNLTLPRELEGLLKEGLVDHVATDLKAPFNVMSGLSGDSGPLWADYLESLRLIRNYEVTLELRVPVARGLTVKHIAGLLSKVGPLLKGVKRMYCVVNPLVGSPLTEPRDVSWAKNYCDPPDEEVRKVAKLVSRALNVRTYVKRWCEHN